MTPCPTCDGHGEMHAGCHGHPHINCVPYVCTTCHGEGVLSLEPCCFCGRPSRAGDICDDCWRDGMADHESQAS